MCESCSNAEMPFLQVPLLEVDGVLINQSQAIAAYLAREFGPFILIHAFLQLLHLLSITIGSLEES